MGYIVHHAIIVNSWDKALLLKARKMAKKIFASVSSITESRLGDYAFLIPPDGSKEGWPDSDKGDQNRATFVAWLNEQAYDDGSNALCYVEVKFGGDLEPEQEGIVSSSAKCYAAHHKAHPET